MSATAALLFEDDFERSFPGWTVVQPPGQYIDGPLYWQYDMISGAFAEQSNIYTDSASYSPSAVAPMLINDATTSGAFTYSAHLTAGDDDGFGLVFGYQNPTNFYRVVFARQARSAGFPWTGWSVDRMVNGTPTNLFGFGKPGYTQTFVNRAGIPFEVTVTVNAAQQLTLTVVDNPTGAATTYPLVSARDLPGSANGQVGIFTWGMSGGSPGGFRIQNLTLSPDGLTGNPNGLTNWTPVIPPRMAGNSMSLSGQPFWSLAAGADGPYGRLEERGDCFAGNDSAGQVDFTGPILVAGNESWSNYVFATRITPWDDDGQGIILRYQNPSNFYRIGLRAQVSNIGMPTGLSIQKNANGVYSEVYRDNPPSYRPANGVPYDLIARIHDDTLNVTLVVDPVGTAAVYNYGPFTVTGSSHGKIGLLSWAMSRTDFDWVSVHDGATIYVASAEGSPSPERGLHSYPLGQTVSLWAGPPDTSVPGVRKFPIGWTGDGVIPATGNATNLTIRASDFSRLTWQWQTEYQLTVTAQTGGTVSFPPGEWFPSGSNITITAQAGTGFVFAGWLGELLSSSPTLQFPMDQPYHLIAVFTADTDGDGLPDSWELAYFGNLAETAEGDSDGDGRTNWQEYQDGTNPNVADILRIERLDLINNQSVLTISNNTGTRFSVQGAITLPGTWTTIATTQYLNTFTSALPSSSTGFWRLQQPKRAPDVLPFVPGSWTLVLLPDTQVYSQNYPELFKDQTRWVVANRDRYNIKYVLQLGDIVNVPYALQQWTNARAAMSILDGHVPYAIATGNHDHGSTGVSSDRITVVNDFFPVSHFTNWPTFGGTYEPNRIENSYHLFSAGGVDWILFALEWGPRNSPVAWANQVLAAYPDRRAILITHAYMYHDETRYDWATRGATQQWNPHSYGTANDPDGTNDGEELWQKLVKLHPNFVLVCNGHVLGDGLGRLSSTNDFGGVVHQMLVNYQMKALGGEAFLRLVEFLPDGKTVQLKAYSPLYGTYKTDSQNQFILTLDPPLTENLRR
ncbi:MAG: hypothetical protein KA236_06965 [Verrucomicrobia bacterium]|nr:hypothetical protein [Verrucomicrobiota bacterium]